MADRGILFIIWHMMQYRSAEAAEWLQFTSDQIQDGKRPQISRTLEFQISPSLLRVYRLGPGLRLKGDSDISPIPLPVFTGMGVKCLEFQSQWIWRAVALRRSNMWNLKPGLGAHMIDVCAIQIWYSLVHLLPLRLRWWKISWKRAGQIRWMVNNSAADCEILLKFGT